MLSDPGACLRCWLITATTMLPEQGLGQIWCGSFDGLDELGIM